MPTWSFADARSGEFTGQQFSGPEHRLAGNLPAGTRAVEGAHDPLTTRFDISSGRVVPWKSPHAGRLALEADRERAEQRLAEIESATLRALREIGINPHDEAARQRLIEYEKQAATLRARIRRSNGIA